MVSSGPCRPSRPRPQRPCREGTAPSRETRVGGQPGATVIYVLGLEGPTTGGCSGVTGGMNKGPAQDGFPAASKPARPRRVRSAGRTREVHLQDPAGPEKRWGPGRASLGERQRPTRAALCPSTQPPRVQASTRSPASVPLISDL